MGKRDFVLRLAILVAMCLVTWIIPDTLGTSYSTEGPVPTVQAVEKERIAPLFRPAEDGPSLRPNHPPIDQIPPMPMPSQPREELPADRGALVVHNAITRDTSTFPNAGALTGGSEHGGGYRGADGGGSGSDVWAAMFNDMYRITNTGDFPWRMNAKLVMRFVDQCNNDRWFVCSGTMRDAEVVLTAGHCVYAREAETCNIFDWAEEIWVYPGWDGVTWHDDPHPPYVEPYGFGHSTYFGSWSWWVDDGNLNGDIGLVGITRAVGMLTGWFGWAYGGSCSWHLGQTYHNASYPSEDCGQPGLHNGRDMYYWYGNFDSCPTFNRLQINTSGGCFNAGWGGMSGSGAYYIESGNRYVHAVASTSDRSTYTRYTRQWEDWVNWTNNTFIPNVRGSSFDLQALDCNAGPTTIQAGGSITLLNHLATNPTNGSANGTWTFRVYLSTNDFISSSDTLLSTQVYDWNFAPMSSVRVNMVPVTIPANTPPGNYWIGVLYDSGTDGNSTNNNTEDWDSAPITVVAGTTGTEAAFRVTKEGDVFADRAFYCGTPPCWNSGIGADIAEYIDVSEPVEPGDVVELDPTRPGYYRKSRSPNSTLAAGVISTTPGVTMGWSGASEPPLFPILALSGLSLDHLSPNQRGPSLGWEFSLLNRQPHCLFTLDLSVARLRSLGLAPSRPLLALMGVVLVKASAANGPIRPGDLLVSSPLPGYAMRCARPKECEGAVIGKALEPLNKGTGLIKALVVR